MDYTAVKGAHAALALVSVAGFIGRAIPALWFDRQWTHSRLLYAVPHVVDTLLLASGVWLALTAGWRPGAHSWLGIKLMLLVLYIGVAMLAIRPALPRPARVVLFVAALLTFAWMLAAALTKSPLGPLALTL